MDQSELIYNYEVTNSLSHAITSGEHGLGNVPGLLKKIIKENRWQERHIRQTKRTVKFERFVEFVAAKPLEGLGSDVKTLRRLCADDPEALDELEKVIQVGPGKHQGNQYSNVGIDNNIHNSNVRESPAGTSQAAALRRLRKSAPKLHEKVIAGDMSANAAMVKAGFRPKTITIPVDVEKAARALVKNFQEDTDKLIEAIQRLK
jgi:hypothetical protein